MGIEEDLDSFLQPLLTPSKHNFEFRFHENACYSKLYSESQLNLLKELLIEAHEKDFRKSDNSPYITSHLINGVASKVRKFEVPPIYELIALFHDFGEDFFRNDNLIPSGRHRSLKLLNENLNRLNFSPFERNLFLHSVGILTKPTKFSSKRFREGTELIHEEYLEPVKYERCMGIVQNNTVLKRKTSKLQQLVSSLVYLVDMYDNGDYTEERMKDDTKFRNWRRLVNFGFPLYVRVKDNLNLKSLRISEKNLDEFMLGDFRNRVLSGKDYFDDLGYKLTELGHFQEWKDLVVF